MKMAVGLLLVALLLSGTVSIYTPGRGYDNYYVTDSVDGGKTIHNMSDPMDTVVISPSPLGGATIYGPGNGMSGMYYPSPADTMRRNVDPPKRR